MRVLPLSCHVFPLRLLGSRRPSRRDTAACAHPDPPRCRALRSRSARRVAALERRPGGSGGRVALATGWLWKATAAVSTAMSLPGIYPSPAPALLSTPATRLRAAARWKPGHGAVEGLLPAASPPARLPPLPAGASPAEATVQGNGFGFCRLWSIREAGGAAFLRSRLCGEAGSPCCARSVLASLPDPLLLVCCIGTVSKPCEPWPLSPPRLHPRGRLAPQQLSSVVPAPWGVTFPTQGGMGSALAKLAWVAPVF